MDPNVLLQELLGHLKVVEDPATSPATRATHAEWLTERFGQLDTLLVQGGLLPDRWRRIQPDPADDLIRALANLGRAVDDVRRELNHVDSQVGEIQELLDEHPTWRG